MTHRLVIAGMEAIADPSGALFLLRQRMLVVADLHLEKGSSFARRRIFLPPYDSAATLALLGQVVARYTPQSIVALGDSFHDRTAAARVGADERATLRYLQHGREWIWIAGNHDPDAPTDCGGESAGELDLGGLILRHEPHEGDVAGEIAGHLHPVAHVMSASGSVRRRCFVASSERCILPAFGAFAGGLNFRDPAFTPLFRQHDMTALVLGRDRVHAVAPACCLPDRRDSVEARAAWRWTL